MGRNAVWMRVWSIEGGRKVFAICICYKGLGDNCIDNYRMVNHGKELEM